MKLLPIVFSLFAVGVVSKNGCGFPDGPTCKSVGKGTNGLEQFLDPDGCCLLPLRCGNEAGERCERVGDSDNNSNNNRAGSGSGFDFSQGSNGGPSGGSPGPPTGKRNARRTARGRMA
ncbi:hypothetical protein PG999_010905 [Apiospora kogelbergensis]|uniref:Uncharacterized protein n=1 Tax=Apiospora kogelbergensis TaxID=1337665 RepID=A0AAW0QDU7_9PEZI